MTGIERKYFISMFIYVEEEEAGRKKMLMMLREKTWPAKQGLVMGKNEI